MATQQHYHIGHNTTGYMPEADVFTVRTKRAAISASLSEAKQYAADERESRYSLTPAEAREMYGRRWRNVPVSGGGGDYYVDDGRSLDTHFWYSGPCDCVDGEKDLEDN